MNVRRRLLALLLLLVAFPTYTSARVHAGGSSAARLLGASAGRSGTLRVSIQPGQIAVGRDVSLRITVTSATGQPVAAQVSITGAGNPAIGMARHGRLVLTVHAAALGMASLQALAPGFRPLTHRIPIVPGSPASVLAITRGLTIEAPHAKPRAGTVGNDLFQDYHAIPR
jgi:hypothetical protein